MKPWALIAMLLGSGCGFTYGTKRSADAAPFSYTAWGGDSRVAYGNAMEKAQAHRHAFQEPERVAVNCPLYWIKPLVAAPLVGGFAVSAVKNNTAFSSGLAVSLMDSFLGGVGIVKLFSEAIAGDTTVEREIQCTDQRWYLVRIVPHKTADQTIGGAVITLIDIEVPKRRAELTRAVDEYAAELLRAVQHPLLILNGDLVVIWANEPYYQRFGVLREEIVGARLASVGNGLWANPLLETALAKTIASGAPFRDLQIDVPVVADSRRFVRVGGSRIRGVANETVLVLLSIEGADTSARVAQR